jgi:hypothetical protein
MELRGYWRKRVEEKAVQLCIICAWRQTCQKQFSMTAGQKCPDYSKDVMIKEEKGAEEGVGEA